MAYSEFIGTYDNLSQAWTANLAQVGINPPLPRRELNRAADLVAEYDPTDRKFSMTIG
jgi:hypothetical protein